MAQSLSAATRSELEHLRQLCQQLEFFVDQPVLTFAALSHGESNQSYYVKTANGHYVLRCYPATSAICRQQELRCQHAAAAKGLAPAPLCLNNHYQLMLSEYIADGVPFDYQQHGRSALVRAVAAYHQLAVQSSELDCGQYLKQLVQALPPDVTPEPGLLRQLQQAAIQLQQLQADTVLCHLDLHAGNLLYANDKLWLLDFEYSQRADSSLDLAGISLHFTLTGIETQVLLEDYAGQRGTPELLPLLEQKLPWARQLYSGFCWLWYLSRPDATAQALHWQHLLITLMQDNAVKRL